MAKLEKEEVNYCDPDITWYHRVCAFFAGDPSFTVSDYDNEDHSFTIYVKDWIKYCLLEDMLQVPKQCKRVSVDIEYEGDTPCGEDLLGILLESNPLFSRVMHGGQRTEEGKALMNFALMKPVAVQYVNDVFNNPYRLETRTAEELARDLFRGLHCNITTDRP